MSGGKKTRGIPEGLWDRLWVELAHSAWFSIALIPASPQVRVGELAEALAAVGSLYQGGPVCFVNAEGIGRSECRSLVDRVAMAKENHGLVLAVDAPIASDSALLLAREADAAVLALELETTPLADARSTISLVGRQNILGAVTLTPEGSWLLPG